MNKILTNPDGKTDDLDFSDTTVWAETNYNCFENADHEITGSTNRIYCPTCGVWWWREGYGVKK